MTVMRLENKQDHFRFQNTKRYSATATLRIRHSLSRSHSPEAATSCVSRIITSLMSRGRWKSGSLAPAQHQISNKKRDDGDQEH